MSWSEIFPQNLKDVQNAGFRLCYEDDHVEIHKNICSANYFELLLVDKSTGITEEFCEVEFDNVIRLYHGLLATRMIMIQLLFNMHDFKDFRERVETLLND